ncbi:xylan 1,4-beta-xylosidase [Actinocorallia longicatena]|uniref:Xylan 1,4-beta-xylosidase n=1 Tax=Actinocorallia longicatena TaxID=111803 RepID=A0ABP6Q2Y2_9ACTN
MSGPPQTTSHLASTRRGRHGRRAPIWMVALIAALAGILTTAVFLYFRGDGSAPKVDERPVGEIAQGFDWPAWGFTHTENSLESTPGAAQNVTTQPLLQAQHIMGFGALNPQETPGRFDWTSLDRRVEQMRQTGGTPVITLCCAPDWMKGGPAGKTDWSHLNDAPAAPFFDAFAEQAGVVAKRYPDIKYFMVWNEFKGFFNQGRNRWDYEGYTQLYNKVYTAVKAANPDAKVGGPYMVVNSYANDRAESSGELKGAWGAADKRALDALKYWFKNKKGADFVVVDGSTLPEDRTAHADEFAATGKFGAVTRWLRANGGGLPVVWSEWYVEPPDARWPADRLNAVQTVAMIEFAESGASGALYWSPQGSPAPCAGCLWDASGRRLPPLEMLQNFARWFKPGTELMPMAAASKSVRVLSSRQEFVAVNTTGQAVSTTVGSVRLDLQPYEVKWVAR